MKIKGIDVSCLSKRQQKTMKEHSDAKKILERKKEKQLKIE